MKRSRIDNRQADRGSATGPETLRVVRFEPIQYVNLTDRVYRVIKDRILSQEIEVGSRLRDEEIAQQLGVSRTPVREAVLRLSREGLVEIIPRSGTRVRTFSEEDLEHIFDLRIALEALAIRKAVARIEPEQIKRLRSMHVKAELALQQGDAKPALEFDTQMHRVILEASGNPRLQEIMVTINDYVALFRNIGARTPYHRGYTYRHREIIRALERRDPDMGARMLSEHIEVAKKELFRDFRQRKLLKPSGNAQPQDRHRRRVRMPASAAAGPGGSPQTAS